MEQYKTNLLCFYKYLKANGLSIQKNRKILELGKGPEFLSMILKAEGFNPFLLSINLNENCSELGIKNRAYGELSSSGIILSKRNKINSYLPGIEEFDTFIVEGIYGGIGNMFNFKKDVYAGFCGNINDNLTTRKMHYYLFLVEQMNMFSNDQYQLQCVRDSFQQKQFGLIKKL